MHALFEDRDGAIWIGVSGAGLARLRGGQIDMFTPAHGLAGIDVRALAQDDAGRIWAATENGLSVIDSGDSGDSGDSETITSFRMAQGLPDNIINGLARARDGGVWIATASGVCRGVERQVTCTKAAYPGALRAIHEDHTGRLWVGTENGLSTAGAMRFPRRAVTALYETRDGTLVVGFGDGRVAILSDATTTEYAAGLPEGGAVVAIEEDHEGSIWIATYNGGLGRLKPRRVATYSIVDGLPAKVVGSIVQDRDGTIWAGAQCGPVSEFRDGRFTPRFTEYTKDACAWVVWPSRDGALWIGTRGHGLYRWFDGRMEHFGTGNGLSDSRVAGLFEDRDGVIWIGTELGGLHLYERGRLSRSFGPADGVATGYLASFAQGRDGRVWIGSNANGLSVYEGGRFRTLSASESPPTRNIANLMVDSRGDLWIGSAAAGVFRRRDGRYEEFSEAQGLGDRLVAVLLEDAEDTIWVSTTRGIARITREDLDAVASGERPRLHPIILDRTDGMLNVEGSGGGLDPSGLRDRAGRLWFSTIDGIAIVDPASFRVNSARPRVLIESAVVGARGTQPAGSGVSVPPGTASVDVNYTAFSFLAPSKVRFQYRLRGFEDGWQDVGNRRTAYYSRLPPGSYVFEVRAANNDGVWSDVPAEMRLDVEPFWWQRPEVQAAALLLLLTATGLGVRFVILRRARARVAELEREQALDRERSRIARDLHDDVGSRLTHIAMMADLGADSAAAGTNRRIAVAARDAVRTMDELVWAVSARNDTVEGFAYYLAQVAEEHIVAAGVRCRLLLPPDLPARPLGADVRRHLFLASKEAVNNAVKHAHAQEIRVSLRVEGNRLVVEVADDGVGLPPDVGQTGNGLENYRERMDAAGGTLTMTSTPGAGTRITFSVPLQAWGT